jgi:hypothetical protein
VITSFEVGAIFKIIDEASPALRRMLRQVNELRAAIDKAKASMAEMTKAVVPAGLRSAIEETNALATAWGRVTAESRAARTAIGQAGAAARGGAIVPAIGGGRAHLGSRLGIGGSGTYVGGPRRCDPWRRPYQHPRRRHGRCRAGRLRRL